MNMKGKASISSLALGILTLAALITPALAQYTVTLTLLGPTGEPLYSTTLEDVDNMTLAVPERLWILINATYGKTTFTAPFNLSLMPYVGPGPGLEHVTLMVTSIPEGFTVTFEPMEVPDVAGEVPGEVDIFDLVKISREISVTPETVEDYDMFLDLNFDLTINVFDLVEVAKHIEIVI
jgi:hypothetical protein